MLPPGGLMEIVFSFDTTGSMASCLNEVRGHIQNMVERLQADISGIRMAVFAHGDYCDKSNYITKFIDFTTDVKKLTDFVKTTGSTGGGDTDECYELVLRQVREELSWTPGSRRSLVLIGDAPPHEPTYPLNKLKIDWREEADLLGEMGVKIYATQCQGCPTAAKFYKAIAEKTNGHHLKLQEFSNVFDFLMAVAYREHGDDLFQVYEKEVRGRCETSTGLNKDLNDLFTTLRNGDVVTTVDVDTPTTTTTLKTAKKRKADSTTTTPAKKAKTTKTTSLIKIGKPTLKKVSPTSKRIVKRAKKTTNPKYPLLRREMVPENNFYLNDRNWSPWQKIVAKDVPVSDGTQWQNTGIYHRKKEIFHNNPDVPSIYEFAVQTKPKARRYVVYHKMAHRVSGKWAQRLFGARNIREQVGKIAHRGYSLFIRRLPISSDSMKRDTISALRRYDYSWNRIRNQRIYQRRVEICSQTISD
ncbi:hypothetical protein LOTGIDRAFT_174892 [Lottia gigantea]|uniref:VWFA domain-containing protein n=1 Tax=Lottia gigantea TaxID=225164 RepID=V4C434_LOTGI|nr:hypothetical protein LOTGIDRAFT_174892 [Lottia gigantea]ESO96324.1 hypothetical protein LOTGIDRAFT_174892 [Lottia gigantea]